MNVYQSACIVYSFSVFPAKVHTCSLHFIELDTYMTQGIGVCSATGSRFFLDEGTPSDAASHLMR